MVGEKQAVTGEDEVIFEARYSRFKVWLCIVVAIIPVLVLSFGAAYLCLLENKYIGAVALFLIGSAGLLFTLDSALLERIVFYRDRLTKYWYLFGSRTIHYSRAMVKAPDRYMRLLSSAHFIAEIKENGKPVPMRLPIMYNSFFFPSDAANTIKLITDYLAEDTEKNPRIFKKAMLPGEVICHTQK